jgi:hypothetical protein
MKDNFKLKYSIENKADSLIFTFINKHKFIITYENRPE